MNLITVARKAFQKKNIQKMSLREHKNSIFSLKAREEIKQMIRFGNIPVVMV